MKLTKFVALAVITVAALGMSACASKKQETSGYSSSSTVGYSK